MKYSPSRFVTSLALGVFAAAGLSTSSAQEITSRKPMTITPPAVQDGSNWSRAPFPAARRFDDVNSPNGQAIDKNVAPNTKATDSQPNALPAPRVAIMQPTPSPFGDPGLLPTGRVIVSLSAALDPASVAPAIRSADLSARENIVADVENHLTTTEVPLRTIRSSKNEMSSAGKTQFSSIDQQVRQSERALRKSIRVARGSTDAKWSSSRERLAADYETYAMALAGVDVAAGVTPAAGLVPTGR